MRRMRPARGRMKRTPKKQPRAAKGRRMGSMKTSGMPSAMKGAGHREEEVTDE